MSSLTDTEKRYLEAVFGMSSGYVLDYTDATFGEFFSRHDVDIHQKQYQTYGTSKAKKLRAFWENEADALVGQVLSEMLDGYEADCAINGRDTDSKVLGSARRAVTRLAGKRHEKPLSSEAGFLSADFNVPDLTKLPIEPHVAEIIRSRLEEVQRTFEAKAFLATILLCGSALEGVLLGAAQQNPASFNKASCCPKRDGKPKPFYEWSLAQFIEAACEIGLLKLDVKKFSHGLRDFRNYIHPYEQLASRFLPDEHTARVCLQVLKAALASLAGER